MAFRLMLNNTQYLWLYYNQEQRTSFGRRQAPAIGTGIVASIAVLYTGRGLTTRRDTAGTYEDGRCVMVLDTAGVVTVYAIWFGLAFTLAAVLLWVNSK